MKVNVTHIKLITTWLRHKPFEAGFKLDSYGWVSIDNLLQSLHKNKIEATILDLELINKKMPVQMWQFDNVNNRIRATHGHSIPVKVDLPSIKPPTYLYHATTLDLVQSIFKYGILPMWRQFVSLTSEKDFAVEYSQKNGIMIVFGIEAEQMYSDSFSFYNPQNTIWISRVIPIDYLFCNSWKITRNIEHLNAFFNVLPAENSIYIYSKNLKQVIIYNTILVGSNIHSLISYEKDNIQTKTKIALDDVLKLIKG